MKIICCNCGKEVANAKEIDGITTWFPVCSECLFNVKGWTKEQIETIEKCYCPICCQKTTQRNTWVSQYCTHCRREHGLDYTWAHIVRQRRLYLGLTSKELSKLLPFKKETIYYYERKVPSKRYIELTEKLVKQMRLTIDELERM